MDPGDGERRGSPTETGLKRLETVKLGDDGREVGFYRAAGRQSVKLNSLRSVNWRSTVDSGWWGFHRKLYAASLSSMARS
jgi:hypothetical protein